MSESDRTVTGNEIPHEVMIAVLDRCDERREFMIQMWLQNPALARQGGAKVTALLTPLRTSLAPSA